MNKCIAAIALAAMLSQPAEAVTFPGLTTIYVGSGVRDNGSGADAGLATAFNCSNVSGVAANVRVLILGLNGDVAASDTRTLLHGNTRTWATHVTATHREDFDLGTSTVNQGVVNIESTQSAVFCNAVVLDAADAGDGFVLPLVRVNPHPGTVE
jgi:hypothetical protein